MKHSLKVSGSSARPPKLLFAVALAAPLLTFSLSSGQAASAGSSPFSTISGSIRSANGTPVTGDVVTFIQPTRPPTGP
jgi:acyl dehydratase